MFPVSIRLYAAGMFCQGVINRFARVQGQNQHNHHTTYEGCLLYVQIFGCVTSTAANPSSSPGLSLTTHRRSCHGLIRLTRPALVVSSGTAENVPFYDKNAA